MTFDPVKHVLDLLRADAELIAILDTYEGGAAIFRSQAPGKFKETETPYVLVDPAQEGIGGLDSFSHATVGVNVPIRLFSITSHTGDGDLSAAALRVRKIFESAGRQMLDPTVLQVQANWPSDTPSGSESVIGRRVLTQWIIKDQAHA